MKIEKILRRALIIFGCMMIVLSFLNFITWVINVTVLQYFYYGYLRSSVLTLFTTPLRALNPAAIGTLCLFAAHSLSPLENPFGKK